MKPVVVDFLIIDFNYCRKYSIGTKVAIRKNIIGFVANQ